MLKESVGKSGHGLEYCTPNFTHLCISGTNHTRIYSLNLLTTPLKQTLSTPPWAPLRACKDQEKKSPISQKKACIKFITQSRLQTARNMLQKTALLPQLTQTDGKIKLHTVKSADNQIYSPSTASLPGLMIATSSWSGICSTARPQSSWDIMHKGKQLWNPAAQQGHSMFVSPDTVGYFGFCKYFRRWEPCASRGKAPLTDQVSPFSWPRSRSNPWTSCWLCLAELQEHFRGALLPGAAAQGYCNGGSQETGREAAAPQDVLPCRLRADHSQGWSLMESVSQSVSQSVTCLAAPGSGGTGHSWEHCTANLQSPPASTAKPLCSSVEKTFEKQVCVTIMMHGFACRDFQHT